MLPLRLYVRFALLLTQQAQVKATSGLIGAHELSLLDARYRLATSESRASTAQGMSSSLSAGAAGGSRRRWD